VAGNLSIGTAWAEAAAFVRRERRLLAPVVLGLIMVPAVVASMFQPQVQPGNVPGAGSWMIVILLMIVAMIVGQLAIALFANGWRGSVGEAIGHAARRFVTLILAGLAVMIPLFMLLTVALAIAGVSSGADDAMAPSFGRAGALVVLLFVVVTLLVTVRLLPLIAVVANGNDSPIGALKHSFRLTRGNFWKLLGFVLLTTIAFVIVLAAVSAVFGSIVTLAFGPPEPWSVSLLLVALVGGLVQAGFVTVYTAMLTRIAVQLEGGSTSGM
jgi:hypothetical protein